MISRFPLPNGKELVVMNTHNSYYAEVEQRRLEMELVKEVLIPEFRKGNLVIAGGDWNQFPPFHKPGPEYGQPDGSYQFPNVDPELFGPDWLFAYDPSVPTNRHLDRPYDPIHSRRALIDYFLCSPGVRLISVKAIDLGFEWSDHNPVIMKIALGL